MVCREEVRRQLALEAALWQLPTSWTQAGHWLSQACQPCPASCSQKEEEERKGIKERTKLSTLLLGGLELNTQNSGMNGEGCSHSITAPCLASTLSILILDRRTHQFEEMMLFPGPRALEESRRVCLLHCRAVM